MHHLQIIGQNHIMIKTLINKNNKIGFTLVEIMVALGIFALLAIPAYMMFAHSASSETEYHINAAANRIMESFRDELKRYNFEEAKQFSKESLPPDTYSIYTDAATKYSSRSFSIDCPAPELKEDKILKFTMTVKWKNKSGHDRKETSTFIKVK